MPHIPGHQGSYMDDFSSFVDNVDEDDFAKNAPNYFQNQPRDIANLPSEIAANALTGVLRSGQMSPEEAQKQADDRRMIEGIQGLAQVVPIDDPLNITGITGYPQGMNPDIRAVDELFKALGQERTAGPFTEPLKEVRKATEKAAKDFEKFQQSQNAVDAAVDRATFAFRTEDPNAFLPPSYGQVDSFGRADSQGRTFNFADTGPEYTFGPSDTLSTGGAKRVGASQISNLASNIADTISRIGVPTTTTGGRLSGIPTSFSLDPGFNFDPSTLGPMPTVDASMLQGGGGLTAQQINDAARAEAERSTAAEAAQRLQAQSGYLGGGIQFAPSAINVPPITRPSYLDFDPRSRPQTVDDGLTYQGTPVESIVNFDQASPTDTQTDTAPEPTDTAPEPADTAPTTTTESFPPRSQSRRGQYFTSGTSVYVYHPFYQDNNGYKYVGETAYTDSDGVQQPSTVNNNAVNADLRRADSNLQDAIANNEMDALGNKLFSTEQPSADAQPSAPGAPSFQPTINQFGQPVVQATDQFGQPIAQPMGQPMGQPMEQVTMSPATYGQVLGGTPVEPNPFQQLYESGLEPFDVFKRYQLSQFPGADLGQRLAVQDSLGTGFSPAYGRYLLGTASQRLLGQPTDALDASGGFGRYLTSQPRASLGQLRQEYSNLANALGSYQTGLRTDVASPTANYLLAFGSPGEDDYRSNILRATQAALGSPVFRQSTLGNIFDVMEQQYGAGAGSRFADFVRTGFAQQPNMQSMQSFAPTTLPSTSAMARQQPAVIPEPTLFGGTMGY